MARAPRTRFAVLASLALAAALPVVAGCGGSYPLPTENRAGREVPLDKSYQMVATWTGMDGIQDVLLTQGSSTQLFLLFNDGGTGTAPRGRVGLYARLKPSGPQTAIPGVSFATLFNPVALCSGGDGAGNPGNRVFVLDQGDTCLARLNPAGAHMDSDPAAVVSVLREMKAS